MLQPATLDAREIEQIYLSHLRKANGEESGREAAA